jgi:hypothetical protein
VRGDKHIAAHPLKGFLVVGLVGLVENMPDGRAQRPGDVVRSMKGDTIEVINTDAEVNRYELVGLDTAGEADLLALGIKVRGKTGLLGVSTPAL